MKRKVSQSAFMDHSTRNKNSMRDDESQETNPSPQRHDCTLTVIQSLTTPCLFPPSLDELHDALTVPWNVRVPISSTDYIMRQSWASQKHTTMFHDMFDWEPTDEACTASSLGRYLGFGTSTYFSFPWHDVGNCLKRLLFNEVACRNRGEYFILSSQGLDLFLATGPDFPESWLNEVIIPHVEGNDSVLDSQYYYLLRCRQDKATNKLMFGYHRHAANSQDDSNAFSTFHVIHEISFRNDNWRLQACIVIKNLTRIIRCLKDYAVPLIWKKSTKLRLVTIKGQDGVPKTLIQKSYGSDHICSVFNATVGNMIVMYRALDKANVPHTDRLVSVEYNKGRTICKLAPVGRAYPPMNMEELLDAMICVSEALVVMHAVGIMHRDIRWANIFHAIHQVSPLNDHKVYFTREWVLFDFEFAATAPQPAFVAHTLTPGNHAPEMVDTDTEKHLRSHGTEVDIWGLGYLMQSAHVDLPISHKSDLEQLQRDCLQPNPTSRPTAIECLERLRSFKARTRSRESDLKTERVTS